MFIWSQHLAFLTNVTGKAWPQVPDPFMTWDLCKGKIPDRTLEVMAVFEKPTCIQAQVWPIALGGLGASRYVDIGPLSVPF